MNELISQCTIEVNVPSAQSAEEQLDALKSKTETIGKMTFVPSWSYLLLSKLIPPKLISFTAIQYRDVMSDSQSLIEQLSYPAKSKASSNGSMALSTAIQSVHSKVRSTCAFDMLRCAGLFGVSLPCHLVTAAL